jgi:hypothetical protein
MTNSRNIQETYDRAERAMTACGLEIPFETAQQAYRDAVMGMVEHHPELSCVLLLSAYCKISHPDFKKGLALAYLDDTRKQPPEESVIRLIHMGTFMPDVSQNGLRPLYMGAIMHATKRLLAGGPEKAASLLEEALQGDLPFVHPLIKEKWALAMVCVCARAAGSSLAAHARLDRWGHKLLNLNDRRASLLQKLLP